MVADPFVESRRAAERRAAVRSIRAWVVKWDFGTYA